MSCCGGNKPKFNCIERKPSVCVMYEGYLPGYSKLKDENCVTVEETTEELYKNQENVLKHLDTSKLGKRCLEYPTTIIDEEEVYLVKDVLNVFEEKICGLIAEDSNDDSKGDSVRNIDLKCLEEDPCYKYESKKDILQLVINKICELENRIKVLENGL